MDGLASWTEDGEEGGLDPLAMGSPVERLYMGLLPGFSTITTRLRQYAFHSWWITDYAERIRVPSRARFSETTRQVEWLYALVNAASARRERGVAGITRARDTLSKGLDPIDLEGPTRLSTPPGLRYLESQEGDFRGTYYGQMREMGLLGEGADHKLPVPTTLGRRLTEAYGASIGGAGQKFLEIAERPFVSRAELVDLAGFCLSALPKGGGEQRLLRRLLLGEEQIELGAEERMRPERTRSLSDDLLHRSAMRGRTLRAIGKVADTTKESLSETLLRWHWLDRSQEADADETVTAWGHFQVGDTVRVVYEALLRRVVDTLEKEPSGVRLTGVGDMVCRDLPDGTLGEMLDGIESRNARWSPAELQARALSEPDDLEDILAPLARLARGWSGRILQLEQSYPPGEARQSASSELAWLEERRSESGREVLTELIRERVVRRHLRVASHKLGRQGNNTFLFDIDSGLLRARLKRPVSPSGPRLTTAVRFMRDAGLIEAADVVDEDMMPLV